VGELMDQLALLEVPPAPAAKRPRRPQLSAEVLRAALQALQAARAGYGHGLTATDLAQLATWLEAGRVWLNSPKEFPRPRTSAVCAWRLSALAHWALQQDLFLEGATAAELKAWCLRLAQWREG